MAIRKRGKSWIIDYYYQGKRIRETIDTNKKMAEDALEARKGEIVQGRFKLEDIRPGPRFEDFAPDYFEWAKINKRSYRREIYRYKKVLLPFFKGKRLNEINTWLIEKFKLSMAKEHKPATVNRELSLLSIMFSKAIEWGKTQEHPIKGGKVKKLREDNITERPLSDEEEKLLLDNANGFLKSIIITALDTGMRRGEILGITWNDVDLKNRTILVRNTKNGKDRRLPMTERVSYAIIALNKSRPYGDWLFYKNGNGGSWAVNSAFRRLINRIGLNGLRFHDFRHTFATRLVTSGIDIVTVQILLGHSDIRMTMRYSHPGSSEMRKAIDILNRRSKDSHKMVTSAKLIDIKNSVNAYK